MIVDIVIIVWLHFLGDFILQNDEMATKKSSDSWCLFDHSIMYAAPMFFFGWEFALITWALHLPVDYVSSRLTSNLHRKGERHWFFVTIGADQAIHLTLLILTLEIVGK